MPPVSQEDLDKLRASITSLSEDIAEHTDTKAEREAAAAREIEFIQLQAEEVRLQAQLASIKEASKVGNVKASSAGLLEQAKANLEQAKVLADAPVGVVDTTKGEPVDVSDTTKGPNATSEPLDGAVGETAAAKPEPKKGSDS